MYRLRYVGVALVAGTVGAAVALLMAPDSGPQHAPPGVAAVSSASGRRCCGGAGG